ncbi:MAG: ABC transporter ATP-binding protein/permease [Bacilli bacterium]|nr:ABC transporter ATP-binding protein/permease [Bacilli bacterium]
MLELKNIYKHYLVDKRHFPALTDVNLVFGDKGLVSVLGPSGCGKSTLLNIIGGLDQYSSGDLIIDRKSTKNFTDADWDAYRNRRIGFIFQSYNLVPHLSVLENVELSMSLAGFNRKQRYDRAMYALSLVGLESVAKKRPNQLSGGQMQRVAIARSLVNHPKIILADEPTGALDSKTSIQVMKILKKLSQEHLVIMVTHNDILAMQYSNRIIRLKDGRVVSDTVPEKKGRPTKTRPETNRHTHMPFFAALGSSFKSLLTKKGRTAMTVVAASFGIIGVAMILAMSNGFSNYVKTVELGTASSVPISISPFVTTSLKEIEWPDIFPKKPTIKPFNEDPSTVMATHHNNITEDYIDYCKKLATEAPYYASSVLLNEEYLDLNLFTTRGDDIIKIDPFATAGATGLFLSGTSGLPSTIFHEIAGDKKYMDQLYDVIGGEYPSEDFYIDPADGRKCFDVALVCDRYNRIPTTTLYGLGLYNSAKADDGVEINFDDLIDKPGKFKYKSYDPSVVYTAVDAPENPITKNIDCYEVDDTIGKVRTLKSDKISKTIKQYLDITSETYKDDLKAFYANDDANDPFKIRISGILRMKQSSYINLIPGSICYPHALLREFKDRLVSDAYKNTNEEIMNAARNNWAITNPGEGSSHLIWNDFINNTFSALDSASSLFLYSWLSSPSISPFTFYSVLSSDGEIKQPEDYPYDVYCMDNYRFSNAFTVPEMEKDDEEHHTDIIDATTDKALDLVQYTMGYSPTNSILIFPKDLASKQNIFDYLDKWNEDHTENKIYYADLAGTVTEALGTTIQIISIVLVCFSAVSLLVSCVMTGVITYTSVLERTKEIGILRAIGARKKDVRRLFEAESVIIGGLAGLLGVVVVFAVEVPISLIIRSLVRAPGIGMICNLNILHALALVAISILLTFVAGFIPAQKAAKKDPVVALRTE